MLEIKKTFPSCSCSKWFAEPTSSSRDVFFDTIKQTSIGINPAGAVTETTSFIKPIGENLFMIGGEQITTGTELYYLGGKFYSGAVSSGGKFIGFGEGLGEAYNIKQIGELKVGRIAGEGSRVNNFIFDRTTISMNELYGARINLESPIFIKTAGSRMNIPGTDFFTFRGGVRQTTYNINSEGVLKTYGFKTNIRGFGMTKVEPLGDNFFVGSGRQGTGFTNQIIGTIPTQTQAIAPIMKPVISPPISSATIIAPFVFQETKQRTGLINLEATKNIQILKPIQMSGFISPLISETITTQRNRFANIPFLGQPTLQAQSSKQMLRSVNIFGNPATIGLTALTPGTTGRGFTPGLPLLPLLPFLSASRGGGFIGGKEMFKYTPSYTALIFNIRGRQTKPLFRGKFTGFEIRNIIKGKPLII